MSILINASEINYGAEVNDTRNPQDILAESTEGIYVVDAGAGTGKTHTIIRRYEKLIKDGVLPRNILLITFTRNAANQMREDVISGVDGDIPVTDFLEAAILNFHALCTKILKKSGSDSPKHLGIGEILAGNFSIIENRYYEDEFFGKFFTGFKKSTSKKYMHIYSALNEDPVKILRAIKKLCSSGIFPMKSGWFIDGEAALKGDYDLFSKKFDDMNEVAMVINNKNKQKQNKLYKIFSDINRRVHLDFNFEEMAGDTVVKPDIKENIFKDDTQNGLIEFMRDVYHSYIEYMLKRNALNFDFVVMFAFLILYNDDKVRGENQFEYVMVDEFQDTDEIQFQLLMLLIKSVNGAANMAVVGDWRQGIYGFRNTTIENITEFKTRLPQFKKILNSGKERILYDVSEEKIKKIVFEYNYRSSNKILDFTRETLFCKVKSDEEFDPGIIEENFKEPLKAKREFDGFTEIGFYQTNEKDINEEVGLVLKKISHLTDDEKYKVREFSKDGEFTERKIEYSDICVLSRSKSFGLKLQKAGMLKGIPVNFGGGLELFATEQGILVLAWLRLILNENNKGAWVPVFEKEGYSYNEIMHLLKTRGSTDNGLFKNNLEIFLDALKERKDNIIFLVEFILKRYGFDDEFGNAIINEISKWSKSDLISLGELVHLIDNSGSETFNIELNKTSNAVVSQTIHSAKGLEFPVVIVANCNSRIFPDVKNITNDIFFHPVSGLRFRKIYTSRGKYFYSFDNWRSEILMRMCKADNYDEERRLLYVASTRAKQYLFFTASNPSPFFTDLAGNTNNQIINNFNYEITRHEINDENHSEEISFPENLKETKKFVSVHSLMNMYEVENVNNEKVASSLVSHPDAIEYGLRVHKIAYKLANGYETESELEEVINIKKFISGLSARELKAETDFLFPRGSEVIRGTIDLLAIYDDRVEVIDYKTDSNKNYLERYRIQAEIYKELVKNIYPDKKVNGKIFFVRLDEIIEV